MKILKLFTLTLLLTVMLTPAFGQTTYKGLPLLKANSNKVDVRIGSVLVNGLWTIKPNYNPNSLHIHMMTPKERLVFYTDVDSAVYSLAPEKSEHFYVLLNKEHYVYTELKGFKKDNEAAKEKLLDHNPTAA